MTLITTAEVADILGVSVATVNRWVRNGTLKPAVRGPGDKGANMFARADIEAFKAAS